MSQKNLLIIMSDEHQARAMGCADHPFVKTPNLDALAASGMRFTNAYTPSPICVPARASFATGRHVHTIRLWDNAMPYKGDPVGWGHQLQNHKIQVESIGKLHYRDAEDPNGFDHEHIPMMVVDGVGMVWGSIRREDERAPLSTRRMLGNYIGPGTSKYTDYDAAITKRTCQWIDEKQNTDQPWCLYVGLVAPHFPLVVPQEFYNLYPLNELPEVKLHPKDGYQRHPWVEKQNAFMDSESKFKCPEERLQAMACYYGLCTWMDHNVGQIVSALKEAGQFDDTTIVYTSDHGDNVGARGLWGKSNMYEEAAAIPLIVSNADQVPIGECATPVSLLDVAATVTDHFNLLDPAPLDGRSLYQLANEPFDENRAIISQYHAAGAVSGGYMLRKANWKYIHYVGFDPELFNLANDPEELNDLSQDPEHAQILSELHGDLVEICDPEKTDELAFADQDAMIEGYGGREVALTLGAPAATPTPDLK